MVKFINLSNEAPYRVFKKKYHEALERGQTNIEALSISSYNREKEEVDSRFVNLKFIDDCNFIFFSNYESPKSNAFRSHNQISALLYWPCTSTQIRMKALLEKTSTEYNQIYFSQRSINKNALAISSKQSMPIESYKKVKEKYNFSLKNDDLKSCPPHWGGFSFEPFEIEFWKGNESRLNKRDLYVKNKHGWSHCILEP